jgi:hypothetical protein
MNGSQTGAAVLLQATQDSQCGNSISHADLDNRSWPSLHYEPLQSLTVFERNIGADFSVLTISVLNFTDNQRLIQDFCNLTFQGTFRSSVFTY